MADGGALDEAARSLLADLGWPVVAMEGTTAYGTVWGDGAATYRSLLVVDEGTQAVFYAQAPGPVPVERRAAAAWLVARANWGLPTAALELDVDSGEARVRCGIEVGGATPTEALLRGTVLAAVAAATVYLPALAAVAAGEDPDAVMARIEGAPGADGA